MNKPHKQNKKKRLPEKKLPKSIKKLMKIKTGVTPQINIRKEIQNQKKTL
jgi:hypothetical protein